MNGNRSQNERNIGSIVIMAIILCAIIASVIIIAFKLTSGGVEDTTTAGTEPSVTTDAQTTTAGVAVGFKTESYTASDVHIGPLAIVNSSNAYNFEAQKDAAAKLYGSIPALNGVNAGRGDAAAFYGAATNSISLYADVINALNDMFTDFNRDMNRKDVLVWVGHRTLEDQTSIYDSASDAAKKDISAPGYSEYHTGYTFSLKLFTDEFNVDPENTEKSPYDIGRIPEVNNWFNLHAHEYGFVARYPAGKGDTDFSSGVNGVYRYVGKAHAYYMWSNNLCLEEYLKLLSSKTYNEPLEIKLSDDEIYHVYFEKGEGEQNSIHLPKDKPYSVSGNNSNGYIITVTAE